MSLNRIVTVPSGAAWARRSGRSHSTAATTSSIEVVDVDPGEPLGVEPQRQRPLDDPARMPISCAGVEAPVEQLQGPLAVAAPPSRSQQHLGQVQARACGDDGPVAHPRRRARSPPRGRSTRSVELPTCGRACPGSARPGPSRPPARPTITRPGTAAARRGAARPARGRRARRDLAEHRDRRQPLGVIGDGRRSPLAASRSNSSLASLELAEVRREGDQRACARRGSPGSARPVADRGQRSPRRGPGGAERERAWIAKNCWASGSSARSPRRRASSAKRSASSKRPSIIARIAAQQRRRARDAAGWRSSSASRA